MSKKLEYLQEELVALLNESSPTPSDQLTTLLKSKEYKNDHVNFEERVDWKISTGSLLLDVALGGGIGPSLVRICGYNNTGKTPQALEIARNFLQMDNTRCLWCLAEGRFSEENKNRCGLKFVTDAKDWTDGSVFILESNVYELFIATMRELVYNNPQKKKYCFVVDSVDAMIRREDLNRSIEEASKVAGPQLLSKKMLQSMSKGMFKFGHMAIFISQVTSEIKLDLYQKITDRGGQFSGGNALLHWSDTTIETAPLRDNSFILDNENGYLNDGKTRVLGRKVSVTLNKSTIETSIRKKIEYPICFGRKPSAIWIEYEIARLMLMYDQVKRIGEKGAWMEFSNGLREELTKSGITIPEKIQGENNLRNLLSSNKEFSNYMLNKLKNVFIK